MPGKERRKLIADPNAQTNMGQSPAGWCFDWPSADSIFPPTVASTQLKQGGTNWGDLSDSKVDAELARISKLSIADQGPEWGKFDKWLMENYLPALPWYWDKSNIVFGTKVTTSSTTPTTARRSSTRSGSTPDGARPTNRARGRDTTSRPPRPGRPTCSRSPIP